MPTYTYSCKNHGDFEHYSSIANYKPKVKCPKCRRISPRNVMADAPSVGGIGDAGPKTVGALAEKNANSMSEDEKVALYNKQNAYRLDKPVTKIPQKRKRNNLTKDFITNLSKHIKAKGKV